MNINLKGERTIAAISTGAAPGGIGIVRISGQCARETADRVFFSKSGKKLTGQKGYTALLGEARTKTGEKLDDVVALVFSAPKSYTGEDVIELSCHGGLYVTQRLLREVLDAGASPAEPGEFTKRAFLNGKMDLTQAEAVMGLIGASGEMAYKAALAAGDGLLSRKVEELSRELRDLSAHLAAWADFPEEDVPQVENLALGESLEKAEKSLSKLLADYDRERIFQEGVPTAIVGLPNTGKSTLMNLLAGFERSIVTEYAGTTRDVVEETVLLGGVPLRLADTAGIRETEDPVEQIGVRAAEKRLDAAQLTLAVADGSRLLSQEDRELLKRVDPLRTVVVVNKSDLPLMLDLEELKSLFPHVALLSAKHGQGLEKLEQEVSTLLGAAGFDPAAGVLFTQRQREDVLRAKEAIADGKNALLQGLTLDAVTVCVEEALNALYALSGKSVSEEIVNQVFEQFCVGK